MADLDDITRDFLVESYEYLDRYDRDLVELERAPNVRGTWDGVLRMVHTIKGTCGFLGFSELERVTHVGEELLIRLRDGTLSLDQQMTSVLLRLGDAMRQLLNGIERTGGDSNHRFDALISEMQSLKDGQPVVEEQSPSPAPLMREEPTGPAFCSHTAPGPLADQQQSLAEREVLLSPPEAPAHEAAREHMPAQRSDIVELPPDDGRAPRSAKEVEGEDQPGENTIRVDLGLLDRLMNLVGELVLARNQFLRESATSKSAGLVTSGNRLNILTGELQESVMKTRMQPIWTLWSKLPRVVRDVATQCGKRVELSFEGKETELDKNVLDAVRQPLLECVRNAILHGIEQPETRMLSGKDAVGHLTLRAFHEGGNVNLEITDDGAGLDLPRLRRHLSVRCGVREDIAERFNESEAVTRLLAPEGGTVPDTQASGLRLAREQVGNIGGTLGMASGSGSGVTLRLKIPLTLAIVPALVVRCGCERYAIPQSSLVELVRVGKESSSLPVEEVFGHPAYRLRGTLLPLLSLREVLGSGPGRATSEVHIVVLQAEQFRFGLIVDSICDTQEIVVKPLSKQLKNLPVYAGVTIMGDGTISLILDVAGIGKGFLENRTGHESARRISQSDTAAGVPEAESYLVVDIGDGHRAAIPLTQIARLEEIAPEHFEQAGTAKLVQYREELLELVDLSSKLGFSSEISSTAAPQTSMPVVVLTGCQRPVGLLVRSIVDIVTQTMTVDTQLSRPGTKGGAVVAGKVTDIVDIDALTGPLREQQGFGEAH